MSIFSKNLIVSNNEAVLNIENVAAFLGISTATVKNWVKCGNLKTFNNSRYNFHLRVERNTKFKSGY